MNSRAISRIIRKHKTRGMFFSCYHVAVIYPRDLFGEVPWEPTRATLEDFIKNLPSGMMLDSMRYTCNHPPIEGDWPNSTKVYCTIPKKHEDPVYSYDTWEVVSAFIRPVDEYSPAHYRPVPEAIAKTILAHHMWSDWVVMGLNYYNPGSEVRSLHSQAIRLHNRSNGSCVVVLPDMRVCVIYDVSMHRDNVDSFSREAHRLLDQAKKMGETLKVVRNNPLELARGWIIQP